MLKHIVFFKLSNTYLGKEKDTIINKISRMLNNLPKSINEIIKIEVGMNISTRPTSYDLSLYVEFDNETDLNAYQVHPSHQQVILYLNTLDIETAVVDYFSE